MGPGRPGPAPAPEELTAWLTDRLPPYAVPAELVALPALPTTAHGKVDHARLPAPPSADPRGRRLARLLDRVEQLSDAEALSALRQDRFAPGGDDVRA
ncbi:hypothetical protein ACFQ2B_31625 [Streptomyces stramineus]